MWHEKHWGDPKLGVSTILEKKNKDAPFFFFFYHRLILGILSLTRALHDNGIRKKFKIFFIFLWGGVVGSKTAHFNNLRKKRTHFFLDNFVITGQYKAYLLHNLRKRVFWDGPQKQTDRRTLQLYDWIGLKPIHWKHFWISTQPSVHQF